MPSENWSLCELVKHYSSYPKFLLTKSCVNQMYQFLPSDMGMATYSGVGTVGLLAMFGNHESKTDRIFEGPSKSTVIKKFFKKIHQVPHPSP